MKAPFLVLIMLLAVLPPTALAQAPDPGDLPDPGELPDPGGLPDPGEAPTPGELPDPEELPDPGEVPDPGVGTTLEELFVPIEQFPCPPTTWENGVLKGATGWQLGSHSRASDGCVAQWGDGSYRVGSQAALSSPGLPTEHLATATAGMASTSLNDVFNQLVTAGVKTDIAAQIAANMAGGCQTFETTDDEVGTAIPKACESMLRESSQRLTVPDVDAGMGGLVLDMHHAYQFSSPDANQFALDGGWIEVRVPGEDWQRLDPMATFAQAREGQQILCAITGPPGVAADVLYDFAWGDTRNTGGTLGDDFTLSNLVEDLHSQTEGDTRPEAILPSSLGEWEEACAGVVHSSSNTAFGSGGQEDVEGNEAASQGPASRFAPYPGVIRGQGPGFVGSTENDEGQLQFLNHWFDLTPFAGETVEVRAHATAGPGAGVRDGGWWVDDMDVRYVGPPQDLAVRLVHPGDGDSIQPGNLSAQVEIVNLGRTDSQPVQVDVTAANVTRSLDIPALPPLFALPMPVQLPLPDTGELEVTAQIAGFTAENETLPYVDAFQPNDQSVRTITVEDLVGVDLDVTGMEVEDGLANVSYEVHNLGNHPFLVPVQATLTPVDGNTRLPRATEATSLGILTTTLVPHGREANSLGVQDPVERLNAEIQLPERGVWKISLHTPVDRGAQADAFAAFGEAAPPAISDTLAAVTAGPTEQVDRGAYQLADQDVEAGNVSQINEDLRHPIEGPETRHVPGGQYALSTSGAELPEEYTPATVNTTQTFGLDETLAEQGIGVPGEVRSPASLQAFNVRQHHYMIYGVGTSTEEASAIGQGSSWDLFSGEDKLNPGEGERVLLEFDHATQADWDNGDGSKARVMIIPKTSVDVEDELREIQNQTREINSQLPPAVQGVGETLLVDLFFETLVNTVGTVGSTAGIERVPEDVCVDGLALPIALGGEQQSVPVPVCSNPDLISSAAQSCGGTGGLRCDFTQEDVATYMDVFDNDQTRAFVHEFEEPTGWETFRVDVTELTRQKQPFFVVFDLQTATDAEQLTAGGSVGPSEEGTDYELPGLGDQQQDEEPLRLGITNEEYPLWTVDDPHLDRTFQNKDLYTLTLCDGPEEAGTFLDCPEEDALPPVGNRGWGHLDADDAVPQAWRYEPLGGDPASLDPGALVWTGGTGSLEGDSELGDDATRIVFRNDDPDPYSVLKLPPIALDGYEEPVVRFHAKWSKITGPQYSFEEGSDDAPALDFPSRCNEASNATGINVYTRTGWNIRATPLDEANRPLVDQATTVEPIGGYDNCSEEGQAPVLFDARGFLEITGDAARAPGGPGTYNEDESDCVGAGGLGVLGGCHETTVQFGHDQPVFAQPMPWQDITVDLSEFEGQRVQLELHAFGVRDKNGDARGELRLDDFTVQEGAPPVDLRVSHDKRPLIAPGTDERFSLDIKNTGAETVEQITVRRVILDDDQCQFVEPQLIQVGLLDPETGQAGLPPGATTTIGDTRLAWTAPSSERDLFQRVLTVDPRPTLSISERPNFRITDVDSETLVLQATDADDCVEDLDNPTIETIDEDGQSISDLANRISGTRGAVLLDQAEPASTRLQVTDPHGQSSLPVYATAPPFAQQSNQTDLVTSRVVQSPPQSTVELTVQPPSEQVDEWELVLPTAEGVIEIDDEREITISDLPAGRYIGYVEFDVPGDDDLFQLVDITLEDLPAAGGDASPGNNEIRLRGETRSNPQLSISEIDLPNSVPVNTPIAVEVTVTNTGNVPLSDVVASLSAEPSGAAATAPAIQLLPPGQSKTATMEVTVTKASSERVTVQADSAQDISAAAGSRLLVLESTELSAAPGDHEGWERDGQDLIFGDGVRVPSSANAPLPLDGTMDLTRAPLSFLRLNASGELEAGYDGVRVEFLDTAEEAPEPGAKLTEIEEARGFQVDRAELSRSLLEDRCDATFLDRTLFNTSDPGLRDLSQLEENCDEIISFRDTLTSSHEGAVLGHPTKALSGGLPFSSQDLTGPQPPIYVSSSSLANTTTKIVDEIEADEWHDLGSFGLDVDSSALDSGRAFWLPTSTMVGDEAISDDVQHQLRIPLSEEQWCTLEEEFINPGRPLTIRTHERRLFSEPSTQSRGWDASVRLETGSFQSATTSISGKRLEAQPVVPLDNENVTGWETVTYQIQLGAVSPLVSDGLLPFTKATCEEDGDGDLPPAGPSLIGTTALVFELRTAGPPVSETAAGALDIGWFIGDVSFPNEMDIGTVGAAEANHELTRTTNSKLNAGQCAQISHEVADKQPVLGCTFIIGNDETTRLDAKAGDPCSGDEVLNCGRHIQVLELSSNGVTDQDGVDQPHLRTIDDLLDDRPMNPEKSEGVLDTLPSDGPKDRFTYVDATALVDLRASDQGALVLNFNEEIKPSQDALVQVAGATVPPGEGEGESAASRVQWTTLPLLEGGQRVAPGSPGMSELQELLPTMPNVTAPNGQDTGRMLGSECLGPANDEMATPPLTPLGATRDRIVGPPVGDFATLPEDDVDSDDEDPQEVCVDLSPIAGHLSLLSLRIWLPGAEDRLVLEDAKVAMNVPEPRRLQPQLRGLTDDSVHEGTYRLHDAEIRSLAPSFGHSVTAQVDDTVEFDGKDLLIPQGFPDVTIQVTQPELKAGWDLHVHANITFEDGITEEEFSLAGNVPRSNLPQGTDSFTGEQELVLPWEDLRKAVTELRAVDGEHPSHHDDQDELPDGEIGWVSNSPVLPANVTKMNLTITTEPTTLEESVGGCETSIEQLRKSTDLLCRGLADLVSGDDAVDLAFRASNRTAGVSDLQISPERGPAGSNRTITVTLENPTPVPRTLEGTVKLRTTNPAGTFLQVPIPATVLQAWDTTEVTVVAHPSPEDERADDGFFDGNDRVQVLAEVGDTSLSDDYRTTEDHPTDLFTPLFFEETASHVEEGPQWAKPAHPEEQTDGLGWRIDVPSGSQLASVSTNPINVNDLEEILHTPGALPILAFQNQRQLTQGELSDGEYTMFAVGAWNGDNDAQRPLLEGWSPQPTIQRPSSQIMVNNEPVDLCTEQGNQNEKAPWGLGAGAPVVLSSTPSGVQPDVREAWETAVFEIPIDHLRAIAAPPQASNTFSFSIMAADCTAAPSDGVVLIDQVSLGSALPLVTISEEEIPAQPGTTKGYKFEITNPGPAGDSVHVVPASTLPEGWETRIETADGKLLYDSETGTTEPIQLDQRETVEGVWRVTLPSTLPDGVTEAVPLTAYAVSAPGISSMGAVQGLIAHGAQTVDTSTAAGKALSQAAEDPGHAVFTTSSGPRPDLDLVEDSLKVQNAEVGREATLTVKMFNRGDAKAEDIEIRAGVNGPAGFQELELVTSEDGHVTVAPGSSKPLTFTWTPRAAGFHGLRILADPGADTEDLLLGGELRSFQGLSHEKEECNPGISCNNVIDHRLEVKPLQKPDLAVRIEGVPDRLPIGEPTTLRVIVENKGGRNATGATLTLSENGLLPILDSLTTDLGTVPAGGEIVLTPRWSPVTPGPILVLASVSAPGEFSGQRADGSLALDDNDVTQTTTVDRAGINLELSDPIRTEPGRAKLVNATITNEGTAPLRISADTTRRGNVLVTPLLDAALEIAPGETQEFQLLGFALLGTQPTTVTLGLPVEPGVARVEVTVLEAHRAKVLVDQAPVPPGESQLSARVVNQGNVPLEGELVLDHDLFRGSAEIHVPVGQAQNVTLDLEVAPGAEAGGHLVTATIVQDGVGDLTSRHPFEVTRQAALEVTSRAGELNLGGSTPGALTVSNIGNAKLDGRLVLDGPVRLVNSSVLSLAPGQTTEVPVTWFSPINQTGTATAIAFGGTEIGTFPIEGVPDDSGLNLFGLSTRPSVNLEEGDVIQVSASVENRGDRDLENIRLGVVVDGQLQTTFAVERLEAGQTTVASTPLELTSSGEVSLGVVDLAAHQRGLTAGPVETIEIAEASFLLGMGGLFGLAPPGVSLR